MAEMGTIIVPARRIESRTPNSAGGMTTRLIIPQVVVEEDGVDSLVITEQPVEQGATITDHIYKRPAQLRLSMGWSDGRASPIAGVTTKPIREIYATLLELQESGVPFIVYTGKRTYPNMLFSSIATTTTQATEFALIISAVCQQIILVQSTTVQLPPREAQRFPEQTAPVEDRGTQRPAPSTLSQLGRAAGVATRQSGGGTSP